VRSRIVQGSSLNGSFACHAKLDTIATTLDTIPTEAVPDFVSLDATTNGAVSTLLREDIRSIANDGIMSLEITDARAFIRALVIFVDAISSAGSALTLQADTTSSWPCRIPLLPTMPWQDDG
jgi:hypothetical protein